LTFKEISGLPFVRNI